MKATQFRKGDIFCPDGNYRYSLTTRIAMCYENDDKLTNAKEIPVGSKQRHPLNVEGKYIGSNEISTDVFCPHHNEWEWKGEAIHWKEYVSPELIAELQQIESEAEN